MKKISGNKLLVKALKEEGVDTLFGYPGACTIDISDELYKQDFTKVILPRQEVALVHEADAYARSTGKVGVCLVTSGPGATNLVTGLATAYYDSVPLVCFTGQVSRHLIGNDAFQEVDIVGITRSITKYGVTVRNREDLGRILNEEQDVQVRSLSIFQKMLWENLEAQNIRKLLISVVISRIQAYISDS